MSKTLHLKGERDELLLRWNADDTREPNSQWQSNLLLPPGKPVTNFPEERVSTFTETNLARCRRSVEFCDLCTHRNMHAGKLERIVHIRLKTQLNEASHLN